MDKHVAQDSQMMPGIQLTWEWVHQEDDYGRARVSTQWADDAEYVSEAIDLCPVDCISYVPRDQLALLEFVMKGCKREDPAILARR